VRVLLTGGYGCIGSWIVKQLLEQGDEVVILDLKRDPGRLRLLLEDEQIDRVPFVAGDVADQEALARTLTAQAITHVIHLAGLQVPTCRANPLLGARVNIQGTLAVFEAVKAAQPAIQRLVYASSAAVYGPPEAYPVGPLADDVPLKPTTHYGYFKVCNEGNARIYYQDFGLSSVGLRPWTVFGVGRDFGMTSEPTKAIKALALGRPYHISYGGWQDLQWAPDVARVFIRSLERPYQGAQSYNLRGHVVDLPTFHRALCSADPAAGHLITYGERQISIAYNLDDSAWQRDLGPLAITPLAESVSQTLAQFRTLHARGRLDTADLDGAAPAVPTTPLREA
jgi:nucleoside-diphosphate-sugar epimerase